MSEENRNLEKIEKEGTLAPRISGTKNLPAGFDEVEEGDIKMPRLALLQALSHIVTEGGAKMGEFANSLTKEVYGSEVEFIPLFMFKTRAQFDLSRGLVMSSRDNITVTMAIDEFAQYLGKPIEEVPGAEWKEKTPPPFGVVYNFPILLVGNLRMFPISFSMMKTATAAAKDLLSMARFSGEDMFARVYSVKARIEKGDKGTYAVPVIEFKRRCANEEYATAKTWYDTLYRRKSNIDVELEGADTITQ